MSDTGARFGVQEETPYLVMDDAPNGTLHSRYPKGTPLSFEQMLFSVQRISSALDYVDAQHIIICEVAEEPFPVGISRNCILLDSFSFFAGGGITYLIYGGNGTLAPCFRERQVKKEASMPFFVWKKRAVQWRKKQCDAWAFWTPSGSLLSPVLVGNWAFCPGLPSLFRATDSAQGAAPARQQLVRVRTVARLEHPHRGYRC
jgi:hypothetical protein